ncbi:unnamed protein product [Prunus armeniaca]
MGSDSQTCNRTLGYPIGRTSVDHSQQAGPSRGQAAWDYLVRGVVVVRLWKDMSLRDGCEMYEYVSAGGVMILSARVGLDMRFVSYTCRWQCRRVSYGVPSPGWTTHPWTRVHVRKSCVPANNPLVGLSSPVY